MPPVVGASKPSNQTRSVSIFGLIQPRVKEFLCGAHVALRQKSPQPRGMPPWREEKGQLSLEFRWRMPEMEHRVPPEIGLLGQLRVGSPAPPRSRFYWPRSRSIGPGWWGPAPPRKRPYWARLWVGARCRFAEPAARTSEHWRSYN